MKGESNPQMSLIDADISVSTVATVLALLKLFMQNLNV